MIRVYTASKLSAAPMWEKLQEEWGDEVHFHARWLRHVKLGTPNEAEHAPAFWLQDEEDIVTADAVLVYGRPDEKLKGALVEAGIALALGLPLIVIGSSPDYSTWQFHPGCVRVKDFDEARQYLKALNTGYRTRVRGHGRS